MGDALSAIGVIRGPEQRSNDACSGRRDAPITRHLQHEGERFRGDGSLTHHRTRDSQPEEVRRLATRQNVIPTGV